MKITCSVNTKVLTNSGKPSFSFSCEHCRQSFLDLGSCMYSERENGAPNPATNPKQAAQEFVWKINAGNIPKSAKRKLCYCDESPTGLVGEWFRTNSRKIDKWELDAACDQIRLYALKDGLDPFGKNAKQAIKELVSAVKEHNANLSSDKENDSRHPTQSQSNRSAKADSVSMDGLCSVYLECKVR